VLKYIVGLIFIALTWAAALVFRGVTPLFWVAIIVTVVVAWPGHHRCRSDAGRAARVRCVGERPR
jgi:hypothetical protein